jgi:hypothetical protein
MRDLLAVAYGAAVTAVIVLVAVLLFAGCPQRGYGPWFYQDVTAYRLPSQWARTPGGVRYRAPSAVDTPAWRASLDAHTEALERCLGVTVRRDWFTVYVPADWYTSTCSGEQLVPSAMPCALCRDKGLVISDACCLEARPTPQCPCVCNARATLQGDAVVTAPNLRLYKAELARLVTGEINPWIVPELARCLQ